MLYVLLRHNNIYFNYNNNKIIITFLIHHYFSDIVASIIIIKLIYNTVIMFTIKVIRIIFACIDRERGAARRITGGSESNDKKP